MRRFIEACEILAEHGCGMEERWPFRGEHDIIYSCVSDTQIPEDSGAGLRLKELGWHIEEDVWARFT